MPLPTTCGPGPPKTIIKRQMHVTEKGTEAIRTAKETETIIKTPRTVFKATLLSTPSQTPTPLKMATQTKTNTKATTKRTAMKEIRSLKDEITALKGIKNPVKASIATKTIQGPTRKERVIGKSTNATKTPPILERQGKLNETHAQNTTTTTTTRTRKTTTTKTRTRTTVKFDAKCCDDLSITKSNSNRRETTAPKPRKNASTTITKAIITTTTTTKGTAGTIRKATKIATTPFASSTSFWATALASIWIPSIVAPSNSPSAPAPATISIPKWLLMLLMVFGILAQIPSQVTAEKSKHYYMQSLCKNHFLQQLYRKIDGAVLWSQNERNLDCIITFQTHSILQRFMLRFDMLQLDCNDHLYVYDGAHAVAQPKIDISCRNTKQTVSSILTRTNFVTLKYVTDNWGTDANGFKLVITSVKDPKHTCKDFTCSQREFCINPDLLCDGVNHCGDNSDESVQNLCQNDTSSTVFGMDMTWFVLIVVSLLLILSAIFVGISICVCRRQTDDGNLNQNTAIQLHLTAETNGSSKHLHHYQHAGGAGGTLSREQTQLPSHHHPHHLHHQQLSTHLPSGNWHHPAGPISGYHRIQRNLSKMSKVRPIWCLANFVN